MLWKTTVKLNQGHEQSKHFLSRGIFGSPFCLSPLGDWPDMPTIILLVVRPVAVQLPAILILVFYGED